MSDTFFSQLQLSTLLKRLVSAAGQTSSWMIVSIVLASLLGSAEALGHYMIFIETAFVTSVVLLLGQDRLIIVLLAKLLKKKQSTELFNQYSRFIIVWLLVLFFFLVCSMIGFYFLPKDFAHPILLGICFAPYLAIFEATSNLLNISGRPMLARCIEIVVLMLFAIPLLYFYHHNIGPNTFLTIAYTMAILYSIASLIGLCIGIQTLSAAIDPTKINSQEVNQDKKPRLMGRLTKPLMLYNIHSGFFKCLLLLKNASSPNKEKTKWLKQGLPLGLARFSDNIFSLVVPLLAIMGVSPENIAYASVACLLVDYNAELSCVIRNHFIPLIAPILPESLPAKFNASQQKQLNRLVFAIRVLIIASSIIILALTQPILNMYGPEYGAAFPMVILLMALMFLTHGWSFNRSVFTLYPELLAFFNKSQRYRFIGSLILIPSLIWLFSVYGAFVAVGLPALLATAAQLWYLKKNTGINLL